MQQTLLSGTALISAVAATATAMLNVAENKAAVKVQGESLSATLQRYAVMAVLAKETDAVKDAMKDRADWKKAKGTWSGAENMAAWLMAGNSFKADKAYIIAGNPVTLINRDTLPLLAAERVSTGETIETSVSTLIKRWRVVKEERATAADTVAKATDERLAAYLRTAEGAAAHTDCDVEEVKIALASDPLAFSKALERGAVQLATEKEEAAEAQHVADLALFAETLATDAENIPSDAFAALFAALKVRADREAAETLAQNAELETERTRQTVVRENNKRNRKAA